MKIKYEGFGYDGEHKSRLIEAEIDESLLDCDIYLEFEKPCGKKLVSEPLEIIKDEENKKGLCSYWLHNELLNQVGYLKIQLVAKKTEYTEKSRIYEYYVAQSINASERINSEFKDVLTDLKEKVDEIAIGGGTSDYNSLENQPLKVITSMDSKNPVILRSLESGLYRLHGYFKPFENYTGALFTVPAPLFAAIANDGTKTYMQLYFAFNNMIQYFEITDETYTNINVMLNDLVNRITNLEAKIAELGG